MQVVVVGNQNPSSRIEAELYERRCSSLPQKNRLVAALCERRCLCGGAKHFHSLPNVADRYSWLATDRFTCYEIPNEQNSLNDLDLAEEASKYKSPQT